MIRRQPFLVAAGVALAAAALGSPATRAADALSAARRATLERFLGALKAQQFDRAFALLSAKEQRYFGSAANYASIFAADRLKVDAWTILEAKPAPGGALAGVKESIEFFDHAHQAELTATARVAYGLLDEAGGVRIKDPYHPWRAFAPVGATVTTDGLRVTVRKVSFFTGYVEVVVTFANVGDNGATVLPYGRTIFRDDAGTVYHPLETRIDQLSDKQLRLGLVLPSAGQYTGTMSFLTPDRFTPKSIQFSFGPSLRDGADAPFALELPAIPVGAA